MQEVIMPRLGFTMTAGVIEKWHKKEGDKVEKGDVLFEVMSDKVSVEVQAVTSGYLIKRIGKEGLEIPVEEVIAYIGDKDEELPAEGIKTKDKEVGIVEESKEEKKLVKAGIESVNSPEKRRRIKISPLARKKAKELGIDYELEPIKGTGPGGRISKDDILVYTKMKEEGIKEKPAGKEKVTHVEGEVRIKSSTALKGMRKVIAERMSYSKKNIPHLVLNTRTDVTVLVELRKKLKDKVLSSYGVKITYTDFLLKICAAALSENLESNSSLQGEEYIIYEDVNVGLAVSVEDGLIVPTFYKCDRLDIVEIAKKRVELVNKAREGKLSLEEITNGTFTLTNLGMFNIRSFSAIINPPQATILAVGEIYLSPAVIEGEIKPRSFMDLSLSCDHRIVDGALGAKFLQKIVELVENPEILIIKKN